MLKLSSVELNISKLQNFSHRLSIFCRQSITRGRISTTAVKIFELKRNWWKRTRQPTKAHPSSQGSEDPDTMLGGPSASLIPDLPLASQLIIPQIFHGRGRNQEDCRQSSYLKAAVMEYRQQTCGAFICRLE